MARMTSKEADDQIFGMIKPFITQMESRLNYPVYVYYPGIDAPRVVDKTRIYIKIERTIRKRPFGVESGSGSLADGEIRVIIFGSEKGSDFALCTATADAMAHQLTRRRCGPDLVMKEATWEDTENRYGRRLFTVVIEYEYET